MAPGPDDNAPITTLRALIRTAEGIVASLESDQLFARLIRAFAGIPEDDREILLGVLEREAEARRNSLAGVPLSGNRVLRPNPNARLYLRVADGEDGPTPTTGEVARATIAATRLIARVGTGIDPAMSAGIVDGLRALARDELDALARFHDELVELLRQARE